MTNKSIAKQQQAIEKPDRSLARRKNDSAISTFKKLIQADEQQSETIIEKITDAAIAAGIAEDLGIGAEKTTRYVVNMTDEMKDAIDRGIIKLDRGKDGQLYAQIRDADNHYGKKLSISEELSDQGVDTLEAMNALQLKAIQGQLDEMAEILDAISQDVELVLQGQQNDRLGLYIAGRNLFLESQNVADPTLERMLAVQALATLSEATAQLELQMQADIQYLAEGKYKLKRGKQVEQIEARMESINKSFQAIHEAALLKASIYYESGEYGAMLAAISEYGSLLETSIVPHAPRLAEFDREDNLLRGGKWETRSNLLASVEGMRAQLSSGSSFYLNAAAEEGDDDEG